MIYSEEPIIIDHRERIIFNYSRVRLHVEYKGIYDEEFVVAHTGFG